MGFKERKVKLESDEMGALLIGFMLIVLVAAVLAAVTVGVVLWGVIQTLWRTMRQ
jgi:hypothetical protein